MLHNDGGERAVMTRVLSAAGLGACAGVRHGFFGRAGGSTECFGARVVGMRQVHSSIALIVDRPWDSPGDGPAPEADALVTRQRGLGLSIRTADCAPILFADPHAGVIGAAHAGWRGALGEGERGIIEATLAVMLEAGAERTSIHAAIGPCIRQASYEVGPEFQARFSCKDQAQFFAPGASDRVQFDLGGYCAARLRRAGLVHIEDADADTLADADSWHSHRRGVLAGEPDSGRNCSVIMLDVRP